ncbi:hypothetical protein [Blastococcus saxobsidens]|uniref:DUF559 domain-containing protein n=1 Tax=Blastococcus saxobsidens TaxID=138336 RepID=A0A4Q7Y4E1_9ACTN|nr:hypothetical protein [Blastococcus saxobsidens]RZU31468.1 hypothetical protein BKA19_1134 [Blastococcus saxobsidens]
MDGVELGPSYTWDEARDRGVSRRQIAHDGIRLGRGLYLSSAVEPTLAERCAAWARVLPRDAAFGLTTAAQLWGAPVAPARSVQAVVTPRSVLPQRRGLQVLVRKDLTTADVVETAGLRLTTPAQTFLDLSARLPPQELVAVGDSLLRAGLAAREDIDERLARALGARGVIRARECTALLSPLSMSRPESLIRYWLTSSALPEPELQVAIRDRWGVAVAHADIGWSRWKVAVEYEGRQHAEREQFGRDIDRYSLMAADGWLTLRFAARHLQECTVVDRARRALLSRGWH